MRCYLDVPVISLLSVVWCCCHLISRFIVVVIITTITVSEPWTREELRVGVPVDKISSSASGIREAVSVVLGEPAYRQRAQAPRPKQELRFVSIQ